MRVTALAGGVGGAKMVQGLSQVISPQNLTVIVNVGDDFEFYGLKISPDIDTVCYTLAGLVNPETGWGLAEESWNAVEAAGNLGGPTWFRLGDRDLGTQIERTRRHKIGQPLSRITADFCQSWGISVNVLPVTDYLVPTIVNTDQGDLPFQEYFVYRRFEPKVNGFRFLYAETSEPAPGVIDALDLADMIVICPSNPFVSVDPILAIPGVKDAVISRMKNGIPVVAVSPIIGGKSVKGPAAKMFSELGFDPSASAVSEYYSGIINGFVFDQIDSDELVSIEPGIQTRMTNTLMPDVKERKRLASEVISFGREVSDQLGVSI